VRALQARRDIRNYVRKGFKRSGTVIFVGGDLEVKVVNDIFGFQIHPKCVQSLSNIIIIIIIIIIIMMHAYRFLVVCCM
jgi:hypothetical protein